MRRPVLKLCAVADCGANAEAQRADFCRVHRYRFERYGRPDDPRGVKSCRVCGDSFMPARADASTCSETGCKAEAKRLDTQRSDARRSSRTPRARSVSVVRVPHVPEWFTVSEVGDRDGWVCARCGAHVDRSLSWPDPLSVTLDLVDLSGPRSFSNSCLAHLGCVDGLSA